MDNTAFLAKLNRNYIFNQWEEPDGYNSGVHFHSLYELYYLEKGSREYVINGNNYNLHPGDVAIIPPGVVHFTTGFGFRRKLVHFDLATLYSIFTKEFANEILNKLNAGVYILQEKDKSKFLLYLSEIEQNHRENNSTAFYVNTMNILLILTNATRSDHNTNSDTLVNRIVLYLQDNFNEKIDLDKIKTEFFTSKYYICHLFKKEKGMTIFEFLLKYKIEQASKLLISTNKKIYEISEECGFSNSYYFTKCFTKAIGISPLQYRKKFKAKS